MLNLQHLFIPLIMFASLDYPYPSEFPVSYRGVSNQDNGFFMVHPNDDLGVSAGYGYFIDTDDTVSYNLRCYDYFAFVYDQYNGNVGITATSGGGGTYSNISNASALTLATDAQVYSEVGAWDMTNYPHMSHDTKILTSAHVIIPDLDYVRNFRISLGSNSAHASDYWNAQMFLVDEVDEYLADPTDLYNLDGRELVNTFDDINDYTELSIPTGYGVIFYHEWGLAASGGPVFFGYEVESISASSGAVPSDWGAENLLTLFGYLFVGMSGIFSIMVFPGLTLGTVILFPIALGVISLVWKITGS